MTVPVLDPNNAPIWLNAIIWMGVFWQYILIGFVPAFYVAITKLFGFPLLQRWSQEVVVILFPSKLKFGKITQQYEPYFRFGKGVYWLDNPLQPVETVEAEPKLVEKLNTIKKHYESIVGKENKTKQEERELVRLLKEQTRLAKKVMQITPPNQVHVFTHAVNQPVYKMERRASKVDEILNNEAKPKKLAGHSIWIMQNPKLHFHRHYQLIVDHTGSLYKIIPVKERQQFSVGFWHSVGIVLQKEVEVEEEHEVGSGGGNKTQLVSTQISTHIVLQQMKEIHDYQNFSASRAFMLLKRRAKIEDNFMSWISGSLSKEVILMLIVLLGAVSAIAMIFFFLHGSGPGNPPPGMK